MIRQMKEANKNKKIYVAIEVVPHNRHIKKFEENLAQIGELGIDAIVITDAGMLNIVKKVIPNIEVHLSDQANITNYMTANFSSNIFICLLCGTTSIATYIFLFLL